MNGTDTLTATSASKSDAAPSDLMGQIQSVIADYLAENPRRSLNALSKRCTVSEPTLRRLLKGQIKTLPTLTTIQDVLTTVTGEKNVRRLAERFPGPIAEYLTSMYSDFAEVETDYDPELNSEMRNSTAYLIYKLASNSSGVHRAQITELFGARGLQCMENLERKGYIVSDGDTYRANAKNFSGSHGDFVLNFKTVADFIKIRDASGSANLDPLLVNFSESISPAAYREIVSIQKTALRKIRTILADPASAGRLPVFLLQAFDTLDLKTAAELAASTPEADANK